MIASQRGIIFFLGEVFLKLQDGGGRATSEQSHPQNNRCLDGSASTGCKKITHVKQKREPDTYNSPGDQSIPD